MDTPGLLALPLGMLVAVGVLWPCAALIDRVVTGRGSLASTGSFSSVGAAMWTPWSDPATARALGQTAVQASASTIGCVVVGVFLAWRLVATPLSPRSRRWANALVIAPFVVPVFAIALAVDSLSVLPGFGDVAPTGTMRAVVVAHVLFNSGLVARIVSPAVAVSLSFDEAAATLGVSPRARWSRLRGPLIAPAVGVAATAVFAVCWGSFGVVRLLGDGRVASVETELWYRATRLGDIEGAVGLGIGHAAILVGLMAAGATIARRQHIGRAVGEVGRGRASTGRGATRVDEKGRGRFLRVVGLCIALGLVAGLPIVALAATAWNGGDVAWDQLTVRPGTTAAVALDVAAANTLLLAVCVAAAAVVCGAAAAVALGSGGILARIVVGLTLVTLALSPLLVGLGLVLANPFGRAGLDGTARQWAVLWLVQTVVALPIVLGVMSPALAAVPRSCLDAAATLGSDATERLMRVVIPLVRRPLAVAASLAAAMSLGEFGATVVVSDGSVPTLSFAVDRVMAQPAAAVRPAAALIALAVVVITVVVAWSVEPTGRGDGRAADRTAGPDVGRGVGRGAVRAAGGVVDGAADGDAAGGIARRGDQSVRAVGA